MRLREQWQPRWGKWPAFVAALFVVLHRAEPVRVRFPGEWRTVWFLFVGNGPYYHPRGMVPAWRPTLDSGLLDVRWLRADVRFSRLRVTAAMLLGALGHSHVYGQREVPELDVELKVPGMLATDGEVVEPSGRYTFRVAAGGAGLPARRAALAGPAAAVRRVRTRSRRVTCRFPCAAIALGATAPPCW